MITRTRRISLDDILRRIQCKKCKTVNIRVKVERHDYICGYEISVRCLCGEKESFEYYPQSKTTQPKELQHFEIINHG